MATALMGDSIATNPFMLGYAYQKGLLPISGAAIVQAIELHGVAVESNKQAFLWGRLAAHDLTWVESQIASSQGAVPETHALARDLDDIVARRMSDLTEYQDARYAMRYKTLVDRVRDAETNSVPGRRELTEAVARYYYKLLAYKDEYEVA